MPGQRIHHSRIRKRVANLDRPIFRAHNGLHFGNMIQADGVGVSVLKRILDDRSFNMSPDLPTADEEDIQNISKSERNEIPQPNCVGLTLVGESLAQCIDLILGVAIRDNQIAKLTAQIHLYEDYCKKDDV